MTRTPSSKFPFDLWVNKSSVGIFSRLEENDHYHREVWNILPVRVSVSFYER